MFKTTEKFRIHALTFILLFASAFCFSQNEKEIHPPSLDDKDLPVYEMKFNPMPDNDKVRVCYLRGTTEDRELRLSIKDIGWVVCPIEVHIVATENDDIKIEFVKNTWDNVVRTGSTSDTYETSFTAANRFGIKIKSNKKGAKFLIAVLMGEEVTPKNNLFIPAASFKGGETNTGANNVDQNTNNSQNDVSDNNGTNWTMILIAGALIGIFALLAVLVFKRKKTMTIIIFFLASSVSFAGFMPAGAGDFLKLGMKLGTKIIKHNSETNTIDLGPLSPDDAEAQPDMDPNGQPQLPSSCYEATVDSGQGGGSQGNDGRDGRDGRDGNDGNDSGTDIDGADGDNGDNDSNDPSGDTDQYGRPKYDKDGNPIQYDDRDHPKYDKDGNPIQYDDSDHPKYDKDGNPITYPDESRPTYDKDGKPISYPKDNTEDRPKYNKDGKPIYYDDSDHPKYDREGNPIKYPTESRPNYDKNGKPIKYQNPDKPKYDKDGKIIDYTTVAVVTLENGYASFFPITWFQEKGKQQDNKQRDGKQQNNQPQDGKQNTGSQGKTAGGAAGRAAVGERKNNPSGNNDGDGSQGGEIGGNTGRGVSYEQMSQGCQCLGRAYDELATLRAKFEKLRIIGHDTKKTVDWALSFGDDVSSFHALSGLAWQTQRVKIVKSYDEFEEAYDKKYKEFVQQLYNVLMKIDSCEAKMGYENWYNTAGFIYYEFMRTRYAAVS